MHARDNDRSRSAERDARTAAPVRRGSGGAPLPGLKAMQAGSGNRAVVQMLRRAASGGQGGGAVQRSTVQDVLRRPGRPLAAAVRSDMEGRMGADFGDVRIHDDSAAAVSAAEVGARAYTSGSHVVLGKGGGDRHTLAHELTHVLQQRQGPVAGTDNGSGLSVSDPADRFERAAEANAVRVMRSSAPAAGGEQLTGEDEHDCAEPWSGGGAVQRAVVFEPFAGMSATAATLGGIQTDTIAGQGYVYPNGGTLGNSLYLERMLSNTGGGSSPGEPADFSTMKAADVNLVRANGQQNAATAMHAINSAFTAGADDTAWNIFMGSAKSNTQEHYNKVERPIRAAMQSGTHGLVASYEQLMTTNPPVNLPGGKLGWSAPGQTVSGAESSAKALKPYEETHPTVTHVLDPAAPLNKPLGRWPKLIHYRVTPNYTYSSNPAQWPQFLKDNLQAAQQLVDDEKAKPASQQDQEGLKNELAAMAILRQRAHQLFPETYSCAADYYLASYDPAAPWYHSSDADSYDAEV